MARNAWVCDVCGRQFLTEVDAEVCESDHGSIFKESKGRLVSTIHIYIQGRGWRNIQASDIAHGTILNNLSIEQIDPAKILLDEEQK